LLADSLNVAGVNSFNTLVASVIERLRIQPVRNTDQATPLTSTPFFTANQRGEMTATWLYIVLSIHCLLFEYSTVRAGAMTGLDSERAVGSDRSADSSRFEENIPVSVAISDHYERNLADALASGAPESFVGDDLFAKARLRGSCG
jgi:hypothetical protein